jgi:hypothetical protein
MTESPNPLYRRRVTDHESAAARDWWVALSALDQVVIAAQVLDEHDRLDLSNRLMQLAAQLVP